MLSSFQLFNFTPCGILCRKRVHIHSHTDTDTHTRTHSGSLAQRTRLRIRQHFPTTPRKLQDFSPLLFSPFYHDLCRINRQKDQVLHAPPGSSLSPAPASSLFPLNCKRIRESASATEHLEFTTAQNEKLQNASRRVKRVRVRVRRQPREPETSPVQASPAERH